MASSSRLDAAHNRVESGNELCAHMDILTADEFIDHLNQYDSCVSDSSFKYPLEPFPRSDEEVVTSSTAYSPKHNVRTTSLRR